MQRVVERIRARLLRKKIMGVLLFASLLAACDRGSTASGQTGTPAVAHERATQGAPARFDYLAVSVADLALMDAFYTRIIGLERSEKSTLQDAGVGPGSPQSLAVSGLDEVFRLSNTRIVMRRYSDPKHRHFLQLMHYPDHPAQPVARAVNRPLGGAHLALEVDDLEGVLEGMATTRLGRVLGGPAVLRELGGSEYALVADPEGNLLLLAQSTAPEAAR